MYLFAFYFSYWSGVQDSIADNICLREWVNFPKVVKWHSCKTGMTGEPDLICVCCFPVNVNFKVNVKKICKTSITALLMLALP